MPPMSIPQIKAKIKAIAAELEVISAEITALRHSIAEQPLAYHVQLKIARRIDLLDSTVSELVKLPQKYPMICKDKEIMSALNLITRLIQNNIIDMENLIVPTERP